MGRSRCREECQINNRKVDPDQPAFYQIRINGHLGGQWAERFEGLSITLEDNDDTLLTGPVVDQAALHGLLKKVRDLGMPLISVNRVKPGLADALEVKPSSPIQRTSSILFKKGETK
jgi:hypothetical protein